MGYTAFDADKIESSPDLITGYDCNLNVTLWNNAIATKYGISKADAMGRNVVDLFPHIAEDFRVKCFRETAQNRKSFYFSRLPYVYEAGVHSQLIMPVEKDSLHFEGVLSIVREHKSNETYLKTDLLFPVLSADLAAATGHHR